ncbi:MAG: ATP-binding protein [Bacilli bacterium]|nr:ATP-binding protein [Bacilli bacterium]
MDFKDVRKGKEFQNLQTSLRQDDELSSIINEAYEELKNDPEVSAILKKLGLSRKEVKDHIGMLREFQKDYHVCANCPGLDACPKDNPHYRIDIANEDGYLERRYSPCQKMIELMQANSRFFVRDFADDWLQKSLQSIDMTKDRNPAIIKMVSLINGKNNDWLYLTGSLGSGRSYMLACFANDFAKKANDAIAFADTASLVERLRALSIEDKAKFDKEMGEIEDCPLLILDGFGDEFKSDFVFSTVLFPLLRERAKRNLITGFSSDFSLAQIEEMYAQKVGRPRAHQLSELILAKAKKETQLKGISIYQ